MPVITLQIIRKQITTLQKQSTLTQQHGMNLREKLRGKTENQNNHSFLFSTVHIATKVER